MAGHRPGVSGVAGHHPGASGLLEMEAKLKGQSCLKITTGKKKVA